MASAVKYTRKFLLVGLLCCTYSALSCVRRHLVSCFVFREARVKLPGSGRVGGKVIVYADACGDNEYSLTESPPPPTPPVLSPPSPRAESMPPAANGVSSSAATAVPAEEGEAGDGSAAERLQAVEALNSLARSTFGGGEVGGKGGKEGGGVGLEVQGKRLTRTAEFFLEVGFFAPEDGGWFGVFRCARSQLARLLTNSLTKRRQSLGGKRRAFMCLCR